MYKDTKIVHSVKNHGPLRPQMSYLLCLKNIESIRTFRIKNIKLKSYIDCQRFLVTLTRQPWF